MTKLEEAFHLFCLDKKSAERDYMKTPLVFKDRIYATNGSIMINILKSYCDFEVPNTAEFDIGKFNFNQDKQNIILTIDESEIEKFKTFELKELISEEELCETCQGYAQVEWTFEHYTMDEDCPVCKGSGLSKERQWRKTGEKTFESNYIVKLGDAYLNMSFFYKLLEVKKQLNEQDIVLLNVPIHNKPVYFQIGKCEILIMPMLVQDELNYEIMKINV